MDIIAEQKQGGATVVTVTHQMEVERPATGSSCSRTAPRRPTGPRRGAEQVRRPHNPDQAHRRHPALAPHYEAVLEETNYSELSITDATDEAVILKDLIDAGVTIRSFTTTKISLEDIFIRVYGDQSPGRRDVRHCTGPRPGRGVVPWRSTT